MIEHVVREGGALYDVVVSSGAASVLLGPPGGPAGWTTRRLLAATCCGSMRYGSVGGYLFDFAAPIVVGDVASTSSAADRRAAARAGGIEYCVACWSPLRVRSRLRAARRTASWH